MNWETIIAGFGGQGLLFAGRVLAHGAMLHGLEVTWMPSYGPQMRGGTATCTVVMADQVIYSPIAQHPRGLIALNRPSLGEFAPRVQPQGVIVVNRSLAGSYEARGDVEVIQVPASEIATRLGAVRVTNLVALGAYVGAMRLLSPACIEQAIDALVPATRPELRALNLAAFREGLTYGQGG